MMRTPSLRRRIVVAGTAVVATVLLLFGGVIYLTLQTQLERTLAGVLAARVELARELGEVHEPVELADQLQRLGIPALVTTASGQTLEATPPPVPRFGEGPPGPVDLAQPRVSARADLGGGVTVQVFATRVGVDTTLRRIVVLLVVGSVVALGAAVLLLRRVGDYAMEPLELVAAAADRTAAGAIGTRLEPDDPSTPLGRMAVAYDQMLDSLEDAVDEARVGEERTRRFVDDAAHQLRTPLAAIRGSVEALLQEPDARVRDRLMSNLVREAARSDRLLSSLLTLARLDQGRLAALAPIVINELCRYEIERIQSLAPTLMVVWEHDPTLARAWLVDEQATREILANLLDNARRHARTRIEMTTRLRDDDTGSAVLELAVRDDGPGVSPPDAALIFERFATLDGHGGSGLGLAIARSLARSQGGELSYGDGGFVLELPAREPTGVPG
jgi:two-component system, OmpR family, sensor kinase